MGCDNTFGETNFNPTKPRYRIVWGGILRFPSRLYSHYIHGEKCVWLFGKSGKVYKGERFV